LLVVLVGIVALALGSASGSYTGVADRVQRGDAYRATYLYSAAADQYLQALSRQPLNPIVLLRLCDISLRREQLDEAEAYAAQAERAGADRIEVAECRARAADKRGQGRLAAAQWSIVAAARPAEQSAKLHLIEAYLAAHDWSAAQQTSQALRDANPADPAASFYLAALLALDDPLRARPYLDGAGSAEAVALAAVLDEPLSLGNPSYRAISLGRVFLEHDRLPLAWRAFLAATTENPRYPDAFAYLGITYDRMGEVALAAACLDRALELDPKSALSLYLRGVYLSRRTDWVKARVDLQRAAALDPDSAPVAFALGRVLAEQGEYVAAETQFTRALTREPDNLDWQLALAELYIGHLIRVAEKGVPAAQRAVDLAPDDARARDWLGWGLHLGGDDARSESELREAIRLSPTLARARLHLGNLLIDVGRIEAGRAELLRAAELDPRGAVGARARQLLGES